jgi:hypothetical protein
MGYLHPFKPHIPLVVTPLPPSQRIPDTHQHEDSAVIAVVLLGVVAAHSQSELTLEEHLRELEGVLEDRVVEVVLLVVADAVVDHQLIFLESCEVPVVAVVDRHNEDVALVEVALFNHPLDLSIGFGEGVGGEVGV